MGGKWKLGLYSDRKKGEKRKYTKKYITREDNKGWFTKKSSFLFPQKNVSHSLVFFLLSFFLMPFYAQECKMCKVYNLLITFSCLSPFPLLFPLPCANVVYDRKSRIHTWDLRCGRNQQNRSIKQREKKSPFAVLFKEENRYCSFYPCVFSSLLLFLLLPSPPLCEEWSVWRKEREDILGMYSVIEISKIDNKREESKEDNDPLCNPPLILFEEENRVLFHIHSCVLRAKKQQQRRRKGKGIATAV